MKKLQNHSWYLGGELSWTVLFSSSLKDADKTKMVSKLKALDEDWSRRSIKLHGTARLLTKKDKIQDLSKLKVWNLVNSTSKAVMKSLGVNIDGLMAMPVSSWKTSVIYQDAVTIVKSLPCTNEAAERACKLAKDYNSFGTTNEKQKQNIFVEVAKNREQLKGNNQKTVENFYKKRRIFEK